MIVQMSMMQPAVVLMGLMVFLVVVAAGVLLAFRWYGEREFEQNRKEAATPVRTQSHAPVHTRSAESSGVPRPE